MVPEFGRCIFVLHKPFAKFAIDLRRTQGPDSNYLETKILHQLCASSWHGRHPPLVFVAAVFTKSYFDFLDCIIRKRKRENQKKVMKKNRSLTMKEDRKHFNWKMHYTFFKFKWKLSNISLVWVLGISARWFTWYTAWYFFSLVMQKHLYP